jgi:peptidoglycan hydrolase-like protein with peptidoglycan-binding domain
MTATRTQSRRTPSGQRRPTRYVALVAVLIPIVAVVAVGFVVVTAKPTISASTTALATVKLPFGGGTVQSVVATGGVEQKVVAVRMSGDTVLPVGNIPGGEKVTMIVTIKRPSWISWVAGKTQQVRLTVTTPAAKLRNPYVTVRSGRPILLHFNTPVAKLAYGPTAGSLKTLTLSKPATAIAIPASATAGSMVVSAAARPWERLRASAVSWFPAGAHSTAVATPMPGKQISAQQPITLTFQKTVKQALGSSYPAVSPAGSGSWETLNAHAIKFVPTGYGYGLGADVNVTLPSGVQLVGGTSGSDPVGKWTVQQGSTMRLQQLLAMLGYLPVKFSYAAGVSVGSTLGAEENAAINAPKGSFSWRYPNTPGPLKALWQAGSYGELTKGAVMSFEDDQDMTTDGVAGPAVWKALIKAALAGDKSTFGYTYVYVSEGSPETESTWHNGKTVASGAVNTGTAAAGGTEPGVFAVFEHVPVTTMSGTNPDGSKYVDPGIPDVSYFNGGDALHGYIRASYGFPQSDGCVEMPYSEAASVYPYTPIGTIVNVVA